ncbi:YceD family protein [Staphylococcus edaphicus]|uniref:DNA-binding protein n=1 Tax=Staphylococcus edaphicus TaxID=1955013 RepID=A0A2C6WR57_9STAP|nr:YceD family protein [Staphylococcus edaphicus]PHK50613.1 DNA-binding protein [Staphylococcus edaphicus]UQW80715.1 YceD family protein [Staphylococcus edaphicus]
MKWSITQLRKFQDKPFEFHQTVNFDHLVKSLDLIDLSDIDVEGELTVKSNEVIADMHITGTYTMSCARTLVPVEVPIDIKSQEIFDLEGYEQFDDDVDDDEHYHDATDGMINLKDIAEELVIIEKPMRVFSKESDQMLREGNGWEVIDEEQAIEIAKDKASSESEQIDPRLQKLQQLYDEEQ